MVLNEWHLVETLVDGEMSVVSCGGVVKDWASVTRHVQPAPPDLPVTRIIDEVIRTRRPVSIDLRSRKGGRRRRFTSRRCPFSAPSGGDAHGVQVWVGGEPGRFPPHLVSQLGLRGVSSGW